MRRLLKKYICSNNSLVNLLIEEDNPKSTSSHQDVDTEDTLPGRDNFMSYESFPGPESTLQSRSVQMQINQDLGWSLHFPL